MLSYFASRIFRSSLTVFLVLSFAFVILRMSGDPALIILSPDAPPEAIEAFRKSQGLDAPLWQQYLGYFSSLLHGEFGVSMRDGRSAMTMVLEAVPATLYIAFPAFVFQLLLGVPMGILAALNRNSFIDRFVMSLSVAGHTLPSFVLGLLLVLIFAVSLGWLPSGGYESAQSAVLPILTLTIGGAAVLARFTRSAMLEVLGRPYIRAAVAKGLNWKQVVIRHALPNAAIPIITIIGLMLGGLVAGAVVVESVFSWPGVGRLLVSAVSNRDLAVVQSALLLITFSMVTANLLVDAVYCLVDPKLRHSLSGTGG
ncbi:ABC transporter permease [Advenella sp. RU8]|jgi:peptide/nickel transport system permease protein|uniref:ABC transporter permease n=1 Tax=unclassified Advenella TaxID=2685285 RepID=UPI00145E9B79|nr:ABC transporter permease [Advenella sp. EE-W14]NLN67933.1 ABC transporter permease [Alcaligenaceae bacterium]